jgi:hypothetical protein
MPGDAGDPHYREARRAFLVGYDRNNYDVKITLNFSIKHIRAAGETNPCGFCFVFAFC